MAGGLAPRDLNVQGDRHRHGRRSQSPGSACPPRGEAAGPSRDASRRFRSRTVM